MKQKTKNKLYAAWAWCDHNDKSTEFMLQFISDESGIEYDKAVDFIYSNETDYKKREQWYKDNSDWLDQWKKDHTI